MVNYIALLRAINVASYQQVAMADLRGMLGKLGLGEPRSLLQSGNLLFQTSARATPKLEKLLESEAAKRLGLATDFFVRTSAEWGELVKRNPFPKEALGDPSHLVVMFLKDVPGPDRVKALQAAIRGPEVVRGDGRHAYIVYPAGIGRSKLSVALIERMLETRGTGRNWNTVMKVHALLTQNVH